MVMGFERERGVKHEPEAVGMKNWKNRVVIEWDGRPTGRIR